MIGSYLSDGNDDDLYGSRAHHGGNNNKIAALLSV